MTKPGVLSISKCATASGPNRYSHPPYSPRNSFSSPSTSATAYANTPSNYKSVICRFWQQTGECQNGELCSFAHGAEEKRHWVKVRRGEATGEAPRGKNHYDEDGGPQGGGGQAREARVKQTFRNDGQFSSQVFAKNKQEVRKGGRKMSRISK